MRRRAWLLGSLGALAGPLAARAQAPSRVHRIGLLGSTAPTSADSGQFWRALLDGLRGLGYVEGKNLTIVGRYYGDRTDQLPALAAELVALKVDVIVAGSRPAPEEARRVTSTIPIVMTNHPDPIGSGLVASLARPGGNVTGIALLVPELRGKQMQLLKEMVPRLAGVAVLAHSAFPIHAGERREIERAAATLKLRTHVVEAGDASDLPGAIAAAKERAGALIITGSTVLYNHRALIAELAARHRLPTMHSLREYAEAGGLVSYGFQLLEGFHRAAAFVDRILKGANPAGLPVQQPTTFEFVVNLRAAKRLGLSLSPALLARADHVIE